MAKGCSAVHQHRETCGTTEYQGCSGNPEVPDDSENSETKSRLWPHHFRISPDCVPHMEKVFSIARNIYDRKRTDNLEDFHVKTAIWAFFHVCHTTKAAVHFNLRSLWTEKLIKEKTEVTGLSTINWDQPMWRESSLLCDRVVRIMKSKTYVFSDSVLCLGGISPEPGRTNLLGIWKHSISKNWIELTENGWNSIGQCPRIHYSGNSHWDSKDDGRIKVWTWAISRKDHLQVHVHCDIIWRTPGMKNCVANSFNVATYAKRCPFGCWSYLGPGCEKKWYGTHVNKPNGEWNRDVEKENHSLQRKWRNRWIDSSHGYFCQSVQYLRSSRRFVQRIGSRLCWKLDLWIVGDTDWECQRQHHISDLNIIGTGKFVTSLFQEIRRTSWRSEIVETLQRCFFLKEDWERTVLHHNWGRIWGYADSMSRVQSTSQHPDRESGFVQIWRSAQSWMWNSILTKDVIALISWSNHW